MFLLLFLCLFLQTSALITVDEIKDGDIITLSLTNYTNYDFIYKRIKLSSYVNITISIEDIPKNVSFVLLQMHSFIHPTSLMYDKGIHEFNNINGTNIGLISLVNSNQSLLFYAKNPHYFIVSTLIGVIGYYKENPIPGGCSMESPTKIAPYLDLDYTDKMITVKAGPSSFSTSDFVCDLKSGIEYKYYQQFLPESVFSEEVYFDTILGMINYKNVTSSSSWEVLDSPTINPLERKFSAYPGIGRVITVTAKIPEGGASVYIPTVSYSCNITSDTGCGLSMTPFVAIENVILAFLGAFICFYGHRYFLINLFIMGTLNGTILSYILLVRYFQADIPDYLMVATFCGVIFGAVWTSTWWCIHKPIISVFIPLFNGCFLLTAIIFSIIRNSIPIFASDINYWFTYFSITLVLLFIAITRPLYSSITSSCLIGSFMVIIPIAIAIGSSVPFVFINVIRRATIDGFNDADTHIPIQTADVCLWIFGFILFVFGKKWQINRAKGRAPFPPTPAILRRDEQTGLLSSDANSSTTYYSTIPNETNATAPEQPTFNVYPKLPYLG